MKKVLCISGGGIRGLLSARILVELENRLPNPLYTYFDLICGTSTGSILASLLLTGKYTAQDCVSLYIKNAKRIFQRELLDGIIGAKYSSDGIESCLKEYFGDMYVRDFKKDCLMPAYDTVKREARFYTKSDNDDTKVWEACRQSSAAPTYFPQYKDCIDGGVMANANGMCALSELGTTQDVYILAIGTGKHEVPYHTEGWGELQYVKPLFDILLSAQEEICDYHLRKLLGDNYDYLQPDLNGVSPDMDNVSNENLQALLDKPLEFDYDGVIKRIIA